MSTTIAIERADRPDALQLIEELEDVLEPLYPSASRHGYSIQKLIEQKVAFFVARHNGQPAGCGGVQLFADDVPPFGEVKRMYVRPQFRGLGLAKLILNTLKEHVLEHDICLLRLETGIYQTEAICLYEGLGFQQIPPFGDYFEDPLSRCYEMEVAAVV